MKKLVIDVLAEYVMEGIPADRWRNTIQLFLEKSNIKSLDEWINKSIELERERHPAESEEELFVRAQTIVGVLRFILYGRIVLAPSLDLTIALMNTKFMNLPVSALHIPYPTFYLKFPDGAFSNQVDDLEGIIVHSEGPNTVHFNFVYGNIDKDEYKAPMLGFEINREDLPEGSLHGTVTLKEALTPVYDYMKSTNMDKEFLLDALNFTISFMLFYTSQKDMARSIVDEEYLQLLEKYKRTKSRHKLDKIQKRLGRLSPSKIVEVRPHKEYKWKLRDVLKDDEKDLPLTSGRVKRAMRLHIVSGHFKNQAYGPNRQLRKLIYIEPYWRGKAESGEVDGRTVIVN